MTTDINELTPIPVHIKGSDIPSPATPQPRRKRYKTVFLTVVLTAQDPVQDLLPASDEREIAWVQALDFDVVVGKDMSTTQAGRNTAQSPATPFQPSGTLIRQANTFPWPIQESGKVFVAATNLAAANGSRVTLTAVYCDGYY